eukprot:274544_1
MECIIPLMLLQDGVVYSFSDDILACWVNISSPSFDHILYLFLDQYHSLWYDPQLNDGYNQQLVFPSLEALSEYRAKHVVHCGALHFFHCPPLLPFALIILETQHPKCGHIVLQITMPINGLISMKQTFHIQISNNGLHLISRHICPFYLILSILNYLSTIMCVC